ncbi:hypothetical protein BDAP_002797 [Binucleata daphniae]
MRTQKIMQNDEFLKLIKGENMKGSMPAVFRTIKKIEDHKSNSNEETTKSFLQVIGNNKMPVTVKKDLVSKLNVIMLEKTKQIEVEKCSDSMSDANSPESATNNKHVTDTCLMSKLEKRKKFYMYNINDEKKCEIDQMNFECKNGRSNCLCYSINYIKHHGDKDENGANDKQKIGFWKKFKKILNKLSCFSQQIKK